MAPNESNDAGRAARPAGAAAQQRRERPRSPSFSDLEWGGYSSANSNSREVVSMLKNRLSVDKQGCRHGYSPPPAECAGMVRIMDDLLEMIFLKAPMHIIGYYYPVVSFFFGQIAWLRQDDHKQWLLSYVAALGTECLLQKEHRPAYIDVAFVLAMIAARIECNMNLMKQTDVGALMHAFADHQELEAHKFFVKRIPCHCVKQQYKRLKGATLKVGKCCGCGQVKEYKELRLCARCGTEHYCSKKVWLVCNSVMQPFTTRRLTQLVFDVVQQIVAKCQTNHWPQHKTTCNDLYASYQKMYKNGSSTNPL